MGKHVNEKGVNVINLIRVFGELLQYNVQTEEPMFKEIRTTAFLDLTWRKEAAANFPLFIFEIESESTKAMTDNVVKVFGHDTPRYQKPLFFFHIIVDQKRKTDRIKTLAQMFDKHNYGSYLINNKRDCINLIKDILNQHLQFNPLIDLQAVIKFWESQEILPIDGIAILEYLTERGYDKINGSDFLLSLENLLVNNKKLREYYKQYISTIFPSEHYTQQSYVYATSSYYSLIIHNAISLLINPSPNHEEFFETFQNIEKSYEPFSLWGPHFGLSRDHDWMLISEFPLLLTLLCAAFHRTSYAEYFSIKLKDIVIDLNYTHRTAQGLVWLLIASQLANDLNSYNFARNKINENGGINRSLIIRPLVVVYLDSTDEHLLNENRIEIPPFDSWSSCIYDLIDIKEDIDIVLGTVEGDLLLISLIEGFLLCDNYEIGRQYFSKYCLKKTLAH